MEIIPNKPFNNIALSLSGGGYRAAAFHLGTLSYLNKLSYDGISLLQRVKVLSTVSGGTFTGMMYALTIQKNQTFQDCYKVLYDLMKNIDLVEESLKKLSDKKNWHKFKNRNLINAFADVYYEKFFSDKFDIFWNNNKNHITEIIFNATEFNNGLYFRFQKTKEDQGYIGNLYLRIPVEAAKEIRVADIVAASSCFPAGFEPISFPNDFINEKSQYLKELKPVVAGENSDEEKKYPVGLMDGGIVDNQGIESVILAEQRMRTFYISEAEMYKDEPKMLDLYIISDVTSPYMEPYKMEKPKKQNIFDRLTFWNLRKFGAACLILAVAIIAGLIFFSKLKTPAAFICLPLLSFILILAGSVSLFFGNLIKTYFPKWFTIPEFFMKPFGFLDRIKFKVYKEMIESRKNSVLTMVQDVFLKQVRRLSYSKIYSDKNCKRRVITNLIYELRSAEVEKIQEKKKHLSQTLLNPGEKIQRVSEKAASMGTTLWFTPEQLHGENNMLDSIIACGQYTICFNILEYIEKIKAEKEYEHAEQSAKDEIEKMYSVALNDWEKFKDEPYWMLYRID